MRTVCLAFFLFAPSIAFAQDDAAGSSTEEVVGAWEDYPRHVAFEVNVLWPIFPGGIVDLKAIVPILLPDRGNGRGELVAGLHSDFGWRSVREDNAGNVAFLGLKIGWRQFLVYGLHVDVTANLGWRHQEHNPWDNETIHSFQGRFWAFAGYQHELTRQVYLNARGGIGVHLFRTDRFADREKILVPAGDLNLGIRFD
jgi:hypothetical protein